MIPWASQSSGLATLATSSRASFASFLTPFFFFRLRRSILTYWFSTVLLISLCRLYVSRSSRRLATCWLAAPSSFSFQPSCSSSCSLPSRSAASWSFSPSSVAAASALRTALACLAHARRGPQLGATEVGVELEVSLEGESGVVLELVPVAKLLVHSTKESVTMFWLSRLDSTSLSSLIMSSLVSSIFLLCSAMTECSSMILSS